MPEPRSAQRTVGVIVPRKPEVTVYSNHSDTVLLMLNTNSIIAYPLVTQVALLSLAIHWSEQHNFLVRLSVAENLTLLGALSSPIPP